MKIPSELRSKLVNEIKFVAEKMRTEKDLRAKVYYFSGIHGEMFRIFNFHFDPQLLFAHNVLNYAYEAMRARSDAIVMGRDALIDFPDGFFDRLCECLEKLASAIENDQDPYPVLQDISCLVYVTTGNGYYLFQKGVLRI
jgi:hypothetical protein